jgi:hypothetical protein
MQLLFVDLVPIADPSLIVQGNCELVIEAAAATDRPDAARTRRTYM